MRLSEIRIEVVDHGMEKAGSKWGFKWPVGFSLSAPPAEPGWVIQKVNVRHRTWVVTDGQPTFHMYKLRLMDGTLVDRPEETYWEAWPVKVGDPNIYRATADRGAGVSILPNPDEYLVAPDPAQKEEDSSGEILVTGRVALYIGDLPQYFEVDQGHAGVLLQSKLPPDFWDDGAGSAHNLYANWNKGDLKRLQTVPPTGNPPDLRPWPAW
jgi:hypothetical protein